MMQQASASEESNINYAHGFEKPLEEKIALLAKTKGFSQGQIAEKIDISRVSVNRFFKGRSSIRTRDLVQLLKVLDIDLEEVVNEKIQNQPVGGQIGHRPSRAEMYQDMISVIENLDTKAQASVFEQVIWWGRCVLNEPARRASERLHSQVHRVASAAI